MIAYDRIIYIDVEVNGVARRKKRRMRRLVGIIVILLALAVLGVLFFGKGSGGALSGTLRDNLSLMVDRMDQLVSAIRNRKGPGDAVPVPGVQAPERRELPAEKDEPESGGGPLEKPISDRDRAKLEKILEDSQNP
jgi:hypothetical protein